MLIVVFATYITKSFSAPKYLFDFLLLNAISNYYLN